MVRMNAFIHDIVAEIVLGDAMYNPSLLQEDGISAFPMLVV